MYNKIYEKIKEFILENYKFTLFLFLCFIIMTFELPYYIDTPGGLINLDDKIEVKNAYKSKGTINLSYVLELKATIPTLIISKFNNDWDVIKKEDVISDEEEEKEMKYRSEMLLEEANDNAIIVAFNKAKKNYKINETKVYVTFVDKDADTNLKVGDQILELNGVKIINRSHLLEEISKYNLTDELSIKIVNDNKYITRRAKLKKENNRLIIGVLITEDKNIDTNSLVKFKFSGNESGPSGGLMETLYIYNSLTENDITKGLTIVGTGSIDENGKVGEIGGVEFKLKGAVKEKADIFFVPNGDNYKEAIKIKNKNSYDIEIIGVNTFEEALEYLNNK